MSKASYWYYITFSLLLTIIVAVLVFSLYFLPSTEKTIEETKKLHQEQKLETEKYRKYEELYLKLKKIEDNRLDELNGEEYTDRTLLDSNDNCIVLSGETLNFSSCTGKDDQLFSYNKTDGLLKNISGCLVEKDNKVVRAPCNNSTGTNNDSSKWEYTPYPLFRYKNKASKRCMISTGSQLVTGLCRENELSQQFRNRIQF